MRPLLSIVFVLTSLLNSRLEAAAPLERIGKEAGLCIVIDNLPDHILELRESPLRDRLESLVLFQKWKGGKDFVKLQNTLSELETMFGQAVPDALLNLAGDQLVLAVYPRAENAPAGLLLSSPRNHALAKQTVDFWNEIEHAKVSRDSSGYWERTTDKGTLYYLLTDKRFALSDRETVIRDLAVTPELSPQKSIYEAPGWLRAQDRFSDRSWIRVWFRPEIWAGILDLPEEKPGLEMLLGQLKRAESVTLELDTEAGLHASLRLLYKPQREPTRLVDYRTSYPADSSILDRPSRETLLSLSGRGGFAPLARLLAGGWPKPNAKETRYFRTVLTGFLQGRDPYEDVLPRMGKTWSIDVRRTEPEAERPVGLLLQVALENDGEDESRASLSSALTNLLETGLHLLKDTETDAAGEVRTVELNQKTRLTAYQSRSGWEPSFLVDENRMMIGSSEDRLRDAISESESMRGAGETPFQVLTERSLSEAQLGLLLNLTVLRDDLAARPLAYLELFRIPEDKRTDSLAALALTSNSLQLFDGGYLLWNCREAEWSLHVGAFLSSK